MEQFLRVVAVFLEVAVLSAILYCMLNGVRLALLDFGIGPKYSRVIVMALAAAGSLLVVFFVAHLSTFYPTF